MEERERAFLDRHYREVARNAAGFALRVRAFAALDRLFCATPLAPWARFTLFATRSEDPT